MEDIKAGGIFSQCHFIEFMGCPGGCIGGGGQPIPTSPAIRAARAKAIYSEDAAYEVRKSHDNPAMKIKIYTEFLKDGPCSHLSHELLHRITFHAASSSSSGGGRPVSGSSWERPRCRRREPPAPWRALMTHYSTRGFGGQRLPVGSHSLNCDVVPTAHSCAMNMRAAAGFNC